MKKDDTVYINGKPYTVICSSDDLTDEERREGAARAAELMMGFGIEPLSPEVREAAGLPKMGIDELMANELSEFRAKAQQAVTYKKP